HAGAEPDQRLGGGGQHEDRSRHLAGRRQRPRERTGDPERSVQSAFEQWGPDHVPRRKTEGRTAEGGRNAMITPPPSGPGRDFPTRESATRDMRSREPRVPLKVLRGGGGLIASGVGKTYRRRPVVRNVSLSLNRGEAVGLLGPNGAGKTTTFYMIVGLVSPDTGSIHLDGSDITTLPMYRRARLGIGYLPQEASVFRGLNVEQNVMGG